MTSVGETLRRERLKRNLDLDQISRELKISGRMLEAIESDHYDQLPGSVFAKAFVRQYARLLGLDDGELAIQVQRAIDPPVFSAAEIARPAVIPSELPRMEDWQSTGDSRIRSSGSLSAAALVVVVMLMCAVVYAWMQRPRTQSAGAQRTVAAQSIHTDPPPPPPPAAITPPVTDPAPATQAPAAGQTAPPASQTGVAPAPNAADPQATPPPQTATPPAPAGPVHVEIVAEDATWLTAKVDGKTVFSGTMEASARRTLDAEKDIVLRLGNAGGVSISLNGKPIGVAGPKGQVRTVQFTSGGFQIVSAKPASPAPLDPLDRF
jgi:cytoskeleton protein RodZ